MTSCSSLVTASSAETCIHRHVQRTSSKTLQYPNTSAQIEVLILRAAASSTPISHYVPLSFFTWLGSVLLIVVAIINIWYLNIYNMSLIQKLIMLTLFTLLTQCHGNVRFLSSSGCFHINSQQCKYMTTVITSTIIQPVLWLHKGFFIVL